MLANAHAGAEYSAPKPYYQDDNRGLTLYQGDSLELLESLPAESFDMVFADPPYFLSNGGVTCQSGRMVSVDKGRWDRSEGALRNHEFNLLPCSRSASAC
jgi:site-specific DNA-methyltransferase (adenine-specific)